MVNLGSYGPGHVWFHILSEDGQSFCSVAGEKKVGAGKKKKLHLYIAQNVTNWKLGLIHALVTLRDPASLRPDYIYNIFYKRPEITLLCKNVSPRKQMRRDNLPYSPSH